MLKAMSLDYRRLLLSPRMLLLGGFGVASGLPLVLTAGTLQAWYTVAGISTVGIGWLTMVGQPYLVKFLWAPFFDRFYPRFLGRRRGWICLLQIALAGALAWMACLHPEKTPIGLAMVALLVAFLSASQDICIDAYRAEILLPDERGVGSAFFVTGYRIGMLLASSIALVLAALLGWHTLYLIMALIMVSGIIITLLSQEPRLNQRPPTTLRQAVTEPFREFMTRNHAILWLLFIVLYKLGDAFALSLTNTFLLRGLDFSLIDVGAVMKTVSIASIVIGGFLGGLIQARFGLFRTLLLFAVLQAISNLGFVALGIIGKDYLAMIIVVAFENLCNGMSAIVFMACLMGLCNQRYTATQYALFSALYTVGRVFVGPVAGVTVENWGWVTFYLATFVVALLPIFVLWQLRHDAIFKADHLDEDIADESLMK